MYGWPEGVRRDILAEVDSTNAEALRRADAGFSEPVWILAEKQSAARGRRGRPWVSDSGNFAGTLLMKVEGSPTIAALRSFVAALALYDALVAATGRSDRISLKWPNDVLLRDRKVAGILLETHRASRDALALAIGFGVNLVRSPETEALEPGAVEPANLRQSAGVEITPHAFLDLLGPAFHRWEERLRRDGFAPVREAWLSRATRLGETITARLPDRSVVGRFQTIDETGAIVLSTGSASIALPAAEIHFGATSS